MQVAKAYSSGLTCCPCIISSSTWAWYECWVEHYAGYLKGRGRFMCNSIHVLFKKKDSVVEVIYFFAIVLIYKHIMEYGIRLKSCLIKSLFINSWINSLDSFEIHPNTLKPFFFLPFPWRCSFGPSDLGMFSCLDSSVISIARLGFFDGCKTILDRFCSFTCTWGRIIVLNRMLTSIVIHYTTKLFHATVDGINSTTLCLLFSANLYA